MEIDMNNEKLDKLPKWAQEYVRKLERDLSLAKRLLDEWKDEQTESPFYVVDYDMGEFRTRYVQAYKMEVEYAGVHLSILLRQDEREIDLSWGIGEDRTGEVALIPHSYQHVKLVSKENMRG